MQLPLPAQPRVKKSSGLPVTMASLTPTACAITGAWDAALAPYTQCTHPPGLPPQAALPQVIHLSLTHTYITFCLLPTTYTPLQAPPPASLELGSHLVGPHEGHTATPNRE